MAKQQVFARLCLVNGVYRNEYTPKGQNEPRIYRTAYIYQSEEGTGDRPRQLELSLQTDDDLYRFEKFAEESKNGKKHDFILDETTFKDNARYEFFCTFEDMMTSHKPALQAAPKPINEQGSSKAVNDK